MTGRADTPQPGLARGWRFAAELHGVASSLLGLQVDPLHPGYMQTLAPATGLAPAQGQVQRLWLPPAALHAWAPQLVKDRPCVMTAPGARIEPCVPCMPPQHPPACCAEEGDPGQIPTARTSALAGEEAVGAVGDAAGGPTVQHLRSMTRLLSLAWPEQPSVQPCGLLIAWQGAQGSAC